MAAIADGIGSGFTSAGVVGRREPAAPSPPAGRGSRSQPVNPVPDSGVGYSGLGRLFAAREHVWAEAGRVRQQDRKLSQVAKQISDNKTKLEQVKLYPPYPPNESRRAEAIREFNGIAAEVRRLVAEGVVEGVSLPSLESGSSTAEAEAAVAALGAAQTRVQTHRVNLAAQVATPGDRAAESESARLGLALGENDQGGLSRSAGELRQII